MSVDYATDEEELMGSMMGERRQLASAPPAGKFVMAPRRWHLVRGITVFAVCLTVLLSVRVIGQRWWQYDMKKMPDNPRPPVSSEKDEVPSPVTRSKGVTGHGGHGMQESLVTAPIHPVRSDKSAPSSLAWFQYIKDTDGTLALKSKFGEYITVLENKKMVARSAARGGSQSFLRIDNNDGTISLMARGGTYVTSLNSGTMLADGPFVQDWQKFTEINGPDGIALKSSQGKFVEILWDINELAYGMPSIGKREAADQHEASSKDLDFIVSINATGENITDAEKWELMNDNLDRTVSLKSTYGTYLTGPKLLDGFVTATNDHIAGREAFEMAYTPDGAVSFRTFDGRWCSALAHGSITATAEKVGQWESFQRIDNSDGTISLKSWHGKYISAIKKAKR
jgi:hypothetical protein